MPREKMDGENLRDGVVEVAFEQRTQRQDTHINSYICSVGSDVFSRYRDTISVFPVLEECRNLSF